MIKQSIKQQLVQRFDNLNTIQVAEYYQNLWNKNNLEDFIYKIITSSKFRKWSINHEVKAKIKKAIRLNVQHNEPIKISFTFGGYKLWRLPTSPRTDWAEVFSLLYYYDWLKLICKFYKPGVKFIFYSDDIVVPLLNNINKSSVETYINDFKQLINSVNNKLVSNFQFHLFKIDDLYSDYEFKNKIQSAYEKINKSSFKLTDPKLSATILNYRFTKSNLTKQEKLYKLLTSYHYYGAYRTLQKRRKVCKSEDQIIVYADHYPTAIGVGTTKSSITKFWIGLGVIRIIKEKLRYKIYSPQAYEKIKKKLDRLVINKVNFSHINDNYNSLFILNNH